MTDSLPQGKLTSEIKSRSLSLLRLMCECGQPSVAGSPVANCVACQVKADYERLREALEAAHKALAQAESVLQARCEECQQLRARIPSGDYVLVSDMGRSHHPHFGAGLFTTEDCVNSGFETAP